MLQPCSSIGRLPRNTQSAYCFISSAFFTCARLCCDPFCASNTLSASISHNGTLLRYFLLLLVSASLAVICNRVNTIMFLELQTRVLYDLQHKIFDSLMRRGLRFHTNTIGGKLVSDAINFTNAYIPLSNMITLQGGPFMLSPIIGVLFIFVSSW